MQPLLLASPARHRPHRHLPRPLLRPRRRPPMAHAVVARARLQPPRPPTLLLRPLQPHRLTHLVRRPGATLPSRARRCATAAPKQLAQAQTAAQLVWGLLLQRLALARQPSLLRTARRATLAPEKRSLRAPARRPVVLQSHLTFLLPLRLVLQSRAAVHSVPAVFSR